MFDKIVKNPLILSIIAVVLIAAAVFVYFFEKGEINFGGNLSTEEVGKMVVDYINENANLGGNTASLVEVIDESGVYRVTVGIADQEYISYASKDGKLLFPEGYGLEPEEATSSAETSLDIPKTDKPDVNFFVMSFCPYGNQAENTMLPVYNLLKDKVNWNIHYIVNVSNDVVTSLHGQPEVDQDEREACVLRESGLDKWWQFTVYVNNNCGGDGSCWKEAAGNAGLDTAAVENCVSSNGLSLMKDEAALTEVAGVTGSPTLIINGVKADSVYQYGNSQAYLEAVCSGFNSAPGECSQQLTTEGNTSLNGGSCQ